MAGSFRVAHFSPLPPAKSGIADYSAALLNELGRIVQVDSFSDRPENFNPAAYDVCVYQLGNNPYHFVPYEMALECPGVVVLHEANLHYLVADYTIKRGDWDGYLEEVRHDSGDAAYQFARDRVRTLRAGPDYTGVPMLRRVLERSRGAIVHSRTVLSEAQAAGWTGPSAVIPHGAWIIDAERMTGRDRLGLDAQAPLIGVFGFLKPYKRIAESLRAFRRLVNLEPRARMILVGEVHPELDVHAIIRSLGLQAHVRVLGFTPIEDFELYLGACDIVLNLRFPTVGETSGTLLRALGMGKAVVVSHIGSFAELPDDVCLKAPVDSSEEDMLFEYLNLLVSRPDLARLMGSRARAWVERECSWDEVARRYAAFLQSVAEQPLSAVGPAAVVEAAAAVSVGLVEPDSASFDSAIASPDKDTEVAEPEFSYVEREPARPPQPAGVEHAEAVHVEAEPIPAEPEPAEVVVEAAQQPQPRPAVHELIPPEHQAEPEPVPGTAAAAEPESFTEPLAESPVAQEVLGWTHPDARGYADTHLTRLAKTLSIIPQAGPEKRVLEMGAYMQMTPLLKTRLGYGYVRGCYYGELGEADEKRIENENGEAFECVIDHFDAEKDRFPYDDESFDTVMCCELIEHLFEDPMHMMGEINRVLKPGGHLVLTTPNIASLRAIAAVLHGYQPGLFPSYIRPREPGVDVDPRHNREYTPREISQLLRDAGFDVELLDTGPFRDEPHPELGWVGHLLERYILPTEHRGDGIYALGRKTGPIRERWPSWLYA